MNGKVVLGRLLPAIAIALSMNGLARSTAYGDDGAVDLIGRGGTFTVIERDGATREVSESSLAVQDGKRASSGSLDEVPVAETNEGQTPSEASEESAPSEKPVPEGEDSGAKVGEKQVSPEAKALEEPKEETPEEKAARQADVRSIRAMLDQGGAYFYDKDNKPLSYQQVNAMIREGDVENIRAQGLHLSSWSPSLDEVKKEEGKKTTSAASSYGASTAPGTKKSVHEIVAEGKPFQETVKDNKPFDPKAYSAGTPEDGRISPLAVPEDRRPLREVLSKDDRRPFDPKGDYTKNYLPDTK